MFAVCVDDGRCWLWWDGEEERRAQELEDGVARQASAHVTNARALEAIARLGGGVDDGRVKQLCDSAATEDGSRRYNKVKEFGRLLLCCE